MVVVLCTSATIFAQTKLTGKVVDETSQPLPGASIVVKGSNTGVSTDFDGTNVLGATWEPVAANLPSQANSWYEFVDSGLIDISEYSGTLYVAFKVVGSGTDLDLDGAYQIDDYKILAN